MAPSKTSISELTPSLRMTMSVPRSPIVAEDVLIWISSFRMLPLTNRATPLPTDITSAPPFVELL